MHPLPKRASSSHRHSLMLFAALLAAPLVSTGALRSTLNAQAPRVGAEVVGRVLQVGDTIGLPGALVEVVGQGIRSTANREGRYRLVGLLPGPQVFQVRLMGYLKKTLQVDLQEGRLDQLDISLDRFPNALTEVRIEGQLRRVPPRYEDVYRRMKVANGKFFTREDIDRFNPLDVQSLLMQAPTVRVNRNGITFARCNGATATGGFGLGGSPGVQIWIDGFRTTGRLKFFGEDEVIAAEQREVLRQVIPSQIQAIEIYSGVARIPGEFLDNACAVIAIWTKSY